MLAQNIFDSSVIQQHLLHDLMVMCSLLILVFGSILSLNLMDQERSFSPHIGFTDASLMRAGDQVSASVGGLFSNLTFELGWSNRGLAMVELWTQFIDDPSHDLLTTEFNSIADAAVGQPQAAVLGVSTESLVSSPATSSIGPWKHGLALPSPRDLEFEIATAAPAAVSISAESESYSNLADPMEAQVLGTSIGSFEGTSTILSSPGLATVSYQAAVENIHRVEFFLNDQLVTTDRTAPYFLGGDNAGIPFGYDLRSSLKSIQPNLRVVVWTSDGESYSDSFKF